MVMVRYLFLVIFSQLFVLSAFARPPGALTFDEFKKLAEGLSAKVDVFNAIWEKDPNALIYAGSTRDYLYWLLGEFRGLSTKQQVADKIKELRRLPVIEFRHISSPESDVDILSESQEVSKLNPQDFAIRKFDIEPTHRLNLATDEGKSEVDQGFVSLEKIVLSKNGFQTLPQFKDGIREIFEGKISIDFSDPEIFWKTKYAQSGENHPILLATRYLRVVIQDYAKRYGTKDYPDLQKLMAPMEQDAVKHIKKIIADATSGQDQKFDNFLKSRRGLSWLNGSLQKSFRSFSHPTAAYMLMKEMGVLDLITSHQEEIQSLNGYLLQLKRDSSEIDANFKKFNVNPKDLFIPVSTFFPDFKLYHGTCENETFRAIVYQGFIPSEDGSAGSGVYGVAANNLEFARNWKNSGDNVIALTLSPNTKIVDITQGPGKDLFEKWKKQNTTNTSEDQFAKDFGIDIIKYPYKDTEAFVLKNGAIIENRQGVFKQPRPLIELINMAEALNKEFSASTKSPSQELSPDLTQKIISFLQDFWITGLNSIEKKRIFNIAPTMFTNMLKISFARSHPEAFGHLARLAYLIHKSTALKVSEIIQTLSFVEFDRILAQFPNMESEIGDDELVLEAIQNKLMETNLDKYFNDRKFDSPRAYLDFYHFSPPLSSGISTFVADGYNSPIWKRSGLSRSTPWEDLIRRFTSPLFKHLADHTDSFFNLNPTLDEAMEFLEIHTKVALPSTAHSFLDVSGDLTKLLGKIADKTFAIARSPEEWERVANYPTLDAAEWTSIRKFSVRKNSWRLSKFPTTTFEQLLQNSYLTLALNVDCNSAAIAVYTSKTIKILDPMLRFIATIALMAKDQNKHSDLLDMPVNRVTWSEARFIIRSGFAEPRTITKDQWSWLQAAVNDRLYFYDGTWSRVAEPEFIEHFVAIESKRDGMLLVQSVENLGDKKLIEKKLKKALEISEQDIVADGQPATTTLKEEVRRTPVKNNVLASTRGISRLWANCLKAISHLYPRKKSEY